MADIPDLARTEVAIVEQTNAFRRSERLTSLPRNPALDHAARLFAQYLAKTGRFEHEADGRQPAARAKAAGYAYCTVAENLALNLDSRGFTTARLSVEAVEGWKNSPPHRKAMLLPHVTETGVGIAQAPGEHPKFLSVQLFGRPESLSFEFRIENRSTGSVSYSFAGETQQLEPRVAVTHKVCDPGEIQFGKLGGWLGATRIDARFEAAAGSLYVVKSRVDGTLQVTKEK